MEHHSELILSIVFDDSSNAFTDKDMSVDVCRLLMQTSPMLCKTNSVIMKYCNRQTAIYLYETMHDCIVSNVLDDGYEYEAAKTNIFKILSISHQDIQRDFARLVIAEYKEYTYLCMMCRLEDTELDILDKYEELMQELYTTEEIEEHYVDKDSELFADKRYYHCYMI